MTFFVREIEKSFENRVSIKTSIIKVPVLYSLEAPCVYRYLEAPHIVLIDIPLLVLLEIQFHKRSQSHVLDELLHLFEGINYKFFVFSTSFVKKETHLPLMRSKV